MATKEEELEKIKASLEELVITNNEYKALLNTAIETGRKFEKIAEKNEESLAAMVNIIKNIHSAFSEQADFIKGNKTLEELHRMLGMFVLNSSVIKMGVIQNATGQK